ncbi:DNA repair protein RecN [Cyclobacteriaceae bacterium]|nr:DNA repair protein RecN [Cyclobacteriaceae bacterium]
MLTHLHIKNYALIEELDLDLKAGFSTITGETGAGKSILLGALGLLLGSRADSKSLKDSTAKCVVEGEFDISRLNLLAFFEANELDYEDSLIIRREITPSAKSRAFINDTPARLETLKALGEFLVDIHSQHQTITLKNSAFQIDVLDVFAQNDTLLTVYQKEYKRYLLVKKELSLLNENLQGFQKELDYNKYLLDELVELSLVDNEIEQLTQQLKSTENAQEIQESIFQSLNLINEQERSALQNLYVVKDLFDKLTSYSEGFKTLSERINSVVFELEDLAKEIAVNGDRVEVNPEKLQELSERSDTINNLLRKHQVNSTEELLAIQADLEDKVQQTLGGNEKRDQLAKECEAIEMSLMKKAEEISLKRQAAIANISEQILMNLHKLGMPNAQFSIDIQSKELGAKGIDVVDFQFSANRGIGLQPIGKVASGGELSRLMFVLKHLQTDASKLATVIFDEIDTGVSGEIAIKMAEMMREMGRSHQIMTITHLPQVAAFGQNQFFVYKDQAADIASSHIRELAQSERVNFIAQMIGGDNPTQSAMNSAKELLQA